MNRIASTVPNASIDPVWADFDAAFAVSTFAANGAVPAGIQGYALITKAGVAALTMSAPTAGLPSAGGNDGEEVEFVDTTGNAHTITFGTNCLNGSTYHIFTFAGHIGNSVKFRAVGGVWYTATSTAATAASGGTLS